MAAVLDQELQHFYPAERNQFGPVRQSKLAEIALHLARERSLVTIANRLALPPALALDLARLALFDVVALLDDSSSMHPTQNRGHQVEMERAIRELAFICEHVGALLKIRFMNSKKTYDVCQLLARSIQA